MLWITNTKIPTDLLTIAITDLDSFKPDEEGVVRN